MGTPKPKVGDGVILFGTVCLMGAPTVLGQQISDMVGYVLFFSGLAGMIIYILVRWGVWALGLLLSNEHGGSDSKSGNWVGRDNTGAQTNFHGPVTFNTTAPTQGARIQFIPGADTPPPAPALRDSFRQEDVYLSALVGLGSKILSGKTFYRCLLKGPIVIKPQYQNTFEFCSVANRPQLLELPEGTPIAGVILLSRNVFTECLFDHDVTILGTPTEMPSFVAEIEVLPVAEWRARYPLD